MVGGGLQIERDTESRLETRTGADDTIDTAVLGIAGEMFFPQSIDLLFSSLLFSSQHGDGYGYGYGDLRSSTIPTRPRGG